MLTFVSTIVLSLAHALPNLRADAPTAEGGDSPPALVAAEAPAPRFGAAAPELTLFALPLPAQTGTLGASAVVQKVQNFYSNTRRFTAKFRQKVHDPVFGRTTKSDGKVWIKKPGKMRWDYVGKATRTKGVRTTKSFISNGQTTWAIDHSNKTFLRKNHQKNLLPVAVTFLYGQGNLAQNFRAALSTSGKYGDPNDYVLKLTPRQPSAQYKHLWLVVDPKNFRVKQSVILNAKGETNSFRFYEPDTKTTIRNTWFQFDRQAAKKRGYRLMRTGTKKRPGKRKSP